MALGGATLKRHATMKCPNKGHICPGVVRLQAFVYGLHFGIRLTQRANQKCPQG